jgi:DNA-binding MarR family transcriptional regulator
MKSQVESSFSKQDLSFQQGMFLHHLAEGGPRPMNEFASLLHCDASNVTGLVDRLEARGLLSRQASDQDRRVKLLVLTPEGQKVREKVLEEILEPPAVMRRLSMADQKALRDILQRAWDVAGMGSDAGPTKTGS